MQATVRLRVTAKGAGKISTGVHVAGRGDIFFPAGAVFECPAEYLEIYAARGIAEPVEAGIDAVRETAPPHSARITCAPVPHDMDAIARLLARGKRDEASGCLLWEGSKVYGGYGQITYKRQNWRTHRLCWVAHNGPVPGGMYVCHACDNPTCFAIEHLFLGTPGENYADMRKKGRSHHNAKLTREQVMEIRARLAAGEQAVTVARDYCVKYGQIILIKNGQAWKD